MELSIKTGGSSRSSSCGSSSKRQWGVARHDKGQPSCKRISASYGAAGWRYPCTRRQSFVCKASRCASGQAPRAPCMSPRPLPSGLLKTARSGSRGGAQWAIRVPDEAEQSAMTERSLGIDILVVVRLEVECDQSQRCQLGRFGVVYFFFFFCFRAIPVMNKKKEKTTVSPKVKIGEPPLPFFFVFFFFFLFFFFFPFPAGEP